MISHCPLFLPMFLPRHPNVSLDQDDLASGHPQEGAGRGGEGGENIQGNISRLEENEK